MDGNGSETAWRRTGGARKGRGGQRNRRASPCVLRAEVTVAAVRAPSTRGTPAPPPGPATPHYEPSSRARQHLAVKGAHPPHSRLAGRGSQRGSPPPPLPPPPAWAPADMSSYAPTEQGLALELLHFARHAALTATERERLDAVVERVRECVHALWPREAVGPRVVLYGSYALGVSIPSSDVDVTVAFPDQHGPSLSSQDDGGVDAAMAAASAREVLLHRLHTLAEYVRHAGADFHVRVFDECRVPVLQLWHHPTGITCDVNLSLMEKAERVVARQRAWLATQPLAPLLIAVTKAALRQWDLNCLFTGGLSSTAVYALVHRYLQQRLPPAERGAPCALAEFSGASSPRQKQPTLFTTAGEEEVDHDGASMALTPSTSSPISRDSNASTFPATTSSSNSSNGGDSRAPTSPREDARSHDSSRAHTFLQCAASDASTFTWPVAKEVQEKDDTADEMEEGKEEEGHAVQSLRLEAFCLRTYGISVARLFLNFWRYLSADVFMMGYSIADAFACESSTEGSTRRSGTYTERSNFPVDLTAGSYRLPELIALFRHSSDMLEGILHTHQQRRAPSMLSSVLVDPRSF